jgi:hypothetical protein
MIDNKEIEKRLASAFDAAAPDMLDDLMAELKLAETPEPQMREKLADEGQDRYKKAVVRSRGFRTLISCAAALIMVIGGLSVWSNINRSVMALVDLDVNPSIELSINGKEYENALYYFNKKSPAGSVNDKIYYWDSACGGYCDASEAGYELLFNKMENSELSVGGTLIGELVSVTETTEETKGMEFD